MYIITNNIKDNIRKMYELTPQRKKLIRNIHENIDDVILDDRKIILNMILFRIGSSFFYEEGLGTRLKYNKLSNSLLQDIDIELLKMKEKTKLNF